MKLLLILPFFFFSVSSWATSVEGKLVYKMPNQELVTRVVNLTVPARGQGEVVLSGKNFEWRTDNFWHLSKGGQTLFFAVFKTQFQDFKSTILFKGTYLKGTNKILYYGDMYKKKGHHEISIESELSSLRHSGGFKFEFDR